jgi:hypothetical protein
VRPTSHTQAWFKPCPTTHKSTISALGPLTTKFKGAQTLCLGVEGTVDGQRVLATTQGLPLI